MSAYSEFVPNGVLPKAKARKVIQVVTNNDTLPSLEQASFSFLFSDISQLLRYQAFIKKT